MVKVKLSLPVISATNIVAWKCHLDDSTAGRYNIIIRTDLLTELGIYIILYKYYRVRLSTVPGM